MAPAAATPVLPRTNGQGPSVGPCRKGGYGGTATDVDQARVKCRAANALPGPGCKCASNRRAILSVYDSRRRRT